MNQDFVLASLNLNAEILPQLFAEHKESLNWEWILEFSRRHKVSGLFISNLEKFGLAGRLPPKIQEQIKVTKNNAQQRAGQAALTLRRLHDALTKEGIPFLIFKGSVFVRDLYGEPAVRPYHDIDLLVSPHLLAKAEDVLISLGYEFYCPFIWTLECIPLGHTPKSDGEPCFAPRITRELLSRFHNHFPYVFPGEGGCLPVDLHWKLFRPGTLKSKLSLADYTRKIEINDLTFTTLGREASVLYLATKIAIDGPEDFSLNQVCDFYRYLKIIDDQGDFRLLEEIADEWGAQNHLIFSLKLTKNFFNFDITPFLNRNGKRNFYTGVCFFVATDKSELLQPRRGGVSGLLKITFCSLFWDLGMGRAPRRAVRLFVRLAVRFWRRKCLPGNANN